MNSSAPGRSQGPTREHKLPSILPSSCGRGHGSADVSRGVRPAQRRLYRENLIALPDRETSGRSQLGLSDPAVERCWLQRATPCVQNAGSELTSAQGTPGLPRVSEHPPRGAAAMLPAQASHRCLVQAVIQQPGPAQGAGGFPKPTAPAQSDLARARRRRHARMKETTRLASTESRAGGTPRLCHRSTG